MKRPVPFAFAPVPRAVFLARREGRLTRAEASVLCGLYDRCNQVTWIASFRDLDSLARLVGWDESLDYLSKVVRALRAKGWIGYDSKPGRTRHGYVIGLRHCPDEASEHGPSTGERQSPSSADLEPRRDFAIPLAEAEERSEQGEQPNPPSGPSSGGSGPSSEKSERRDGEPSSDGFGPPLVRATRDASRQDLALAKREVLGPGSRFTPGPEGRCVGCGRYSECQDCARVRRAAEVAA